MKPTNLKRKVKQPTQKEIADKEMTIEEELTEQAKAAVFLGQAPGNVFTGAYFDDAASILSEITQKRDWKSLTGKEDDIADYMPKPELANKSIDGEPQYTNQFSTYFSGTGIPHPVAYTAAKALKDVSPHHNSCIKTKVSATIGLGFVSTGEADATITRGDMPETEVKRMINDLLSGEARIQTDVDKVLNPLCHDLFQHELSAAVEDFFDCGTGYLEVVRDDGNAIVGVNWLPVEDIYAYTIQENEGQVWTFYRYIHATGYPRFFCPFGIKNKEKAVEFFKDDENNKKSDISEIIVFKVPNNRVRWYGYPDWLSAAPLVDLFRRAEQYKSDFYTNRGVLDFILSIMGQVDDATKTALSAAITNTTGAGNNFRNLLLTLPVEGKVQLDKLAADQGKEEQFSHDIDILSQFIVSAHRVPPVLANILIAGKMGAANETVQGLTMFQLMVAGPAQNLIQTTLGNTLGGPDGVKGEVALNAESFRLRTITSQIDIVGMDAISRSREEAQTDTEANGEPRDFSQGVKE
ncbi:MAG: phage portal protein [Planctomycetes bacterium]|nr:phage portal protein [Planctomycetota bacterium]